MSKLANHYGRNLRDRWLVPYSDFVTLLFAVFAVLYTVERTGKYNTRQVVDSVMGVQPSVVVKQDTPPPLAENDTAQAEEAAKADPAGNRAVKTAESALMEAIRIALGAEIANGNADVRIEQRGVVISLGQAAFFKSGRPEVDPACYPIVDKVADIIRAAPNLIRLEGHTDNVPIRNSRFKNNWELSAARSIAVLDLLVDRYGISRERLSVAGFADTSPLQPNDDPAGRASNRRVDLVILSPVPAPV